MELEMLKETSVKSVKNEMIKKGKLEVCWTIYDIPPKKRKNLISDFTKKNELTGDIIQKMVEFAQVVFNSKKMKVINDYDYPANQVTLTKLELFNEEDKPITRIFKVSTNRIINFAFNSSAALATLEDLLELGADNKLVDVLKNVKGRSLAALGSKIIYESNVYIPVFNSWYN
ncbi:MAG: hypothetical protein V1692_00210, partial [bacterium]